ncbi:MAG TPA: hypothetical protein P5200_14025 [Tenuifilaceae bacterium]|nr:hypothetical protein [Tenuifilaceae bacterium]HRX69487.1 hypothetical protein [Tenuifilaceae bacterium]
MKRKSLNYITIFFGAITCFLLLFYSCQKEEDKFSIMNTSTLKFQKDVQVADETRENTITIRVSSNDESLPLLYSEKNFKLIPIYEGKSSCETINSIYTDNYSTEYTEQESNEENSKVSVNPISFEIISQKLAENVKGIAITYMHPDFGDDKGEQYFWHYSQAIQNLERTASICDTHWWWDVHFGLKYKAYSTSSWSTVVSEWTKVPNKDCTTKTKDIIYQYQMHVRCRRSSAYTVTFEY